MVDVEPCPPGTRIRQVQGFVNVEKWGSVLLEVDGERGKHIMQLCETLIVLDINVNLFSLQRVINGGFLPVYGEVVVHFFFLGCNSGSHRGSHNRCR